MCLYKQHKKLKPTHIKDQMPLLIYNETKYSNYMLFIIHSTDILNNGIYSNINTIIIQINDTKYDNPLNKENR